MDLDDPFNPELQYSKLKSMEEADAVDAEDVKPRMLPSVERPHHLLRDLPLVQQHPEHLVPEDGLQLSAVRVDKVNFKRALKMAEAW